ncbi:MAG: TRAP transporter substrate-binding protein DctP [Clostridiales Family XIII bacterium]|jgi:TRAP-type C4-dicarboxylate transport system substrate-binding protein|nr:TRAP transporter substrate-binding protein DctP [Clostridiales Family XIII bacterium]
MLKRLTVFLAVLALLATVTACGGGGNADNAGDVPAEETEATGNVAEEEEAAGADMPQVTLSLANYLPAGNPIEEYVVNPLTEGLKAGNMEVEYFPGATLLEGDQILDGVINGTADMGIVAVAYTVGRFPISFMFEYPMEYVSAKAASYTMKEAIAELNPEELSDIKVLFPFCSGPGAFLSKNPITSFEDMKGLQIRANAIQAESMRAVGAVPATLTMGETYDALRSGIVDAFVGLQDAGYTFKLYEVAQNMTFYPFCNIAFYVIMSNDTYDSLTDAQKKIVDEVSEKVFTESASMYQGWSGQLTIDAVQENGGELITLSAEEIAKFKEATGGLLDAYAAGLDADGLNGTEAKELILRIAAENNAKYPDNGE